jgi:hypothetical protein
MRQLFILLISCILFISFQQVKYVKTKVNDDISLLLPSEFTLMSQADLNTKYASSKAPIAVYTDYSRYVDLGVNVAYSRWNEEDLEIMKSFYKSNIMGLYNEVQFIKEDIENINGKDFAVFEFISSVYDEVGEAPNQNAISKYVRIQYCISKSKTVLFNFSCPARQKDKWAPVAKQILESVKISKTL